MSRGLLGLAAAAILLWLPTRQVSRPPTSAVLGASLGLFAEDPTYDYGHFLDELASRGATDVLIVVPLVQSDLRSHDLRLVPGQSPAVPTVRRTARQARERGLRWGLLPVVRLAQRGPDEWRGVLQPEAGADAWFESYKDALVPLLEVAHAEGAAQFGIGSELSSLERHQDHWRRLAATVQASDVGDVFYAANWDRVDQVPFWDAVDHIGLSGYYELANPGDPTDVASLKAAWQGPKEALARTAAKTEREVLFVEVGYPSHALAAERPWDYTATAPIDLDLQARLWRAFCDSFHDEQHIQGFYAWNWFGWGGPRDMGYTPRGKPAAAELQRCWTDEAWAR